MVKILVILSLYIIYVALGQFVREGQECLPHNVVVKVTLKPRTVPGMNSGGPLSPCDFYLVPLWFLSCHQSLASLLSVHVSSAPNFNFLLVFHRLAFPPTCWLGKYCVYIDNPLLTLVLEIQT